MSQTYSPRNAGSTESDRSRVLIIDDDVKFCGLIKDYLEPFGFEIETIHSGIDGLDASLDPKLSAIMLDVMLPEIDGFEVLRQLRMSSEVPVLMLTARGDEADRIVGLELGADDYVPKTASTREVLARLRAIMRRVSPRFGTSKIQLPVAPAEDELIRVAELEIEMASHTVRLGGDRLTLTPVEFALLVVLARPPGRVRSREQLVEAVADRDFDVFDRSVDVHISSLRKKMGDDARSPRFIRTVRAVGYMLVNPDRDY